MKKITATVVIATIAVFIAACANTPTNTNTANSVSNENAANANATPANSGSMHGGEGGDHGNHSQIGDQQRRDGMKKGQEGMQREMRHDSVPNTNNDRNSNQK